MIPLPPPAQVIETFGGLLDVRVEIDTGEGPTFVGALWDSGLWDEDQWNAEDPSWYDMTAFVEEVSIDRGAERWGDRFRTGTATILVDNTSGIFTPDSGVEMPWIIPFRPGRKMRVTVIHDGNPANRQAIFTGSLDESQDRFAGAGYEIRAELRCSDFMSIWQDANPVALVTATGVQGTDERVNAALDRISWPAGLRDIQNGSHTMMSSFLAQSVLEECARAAEAEGGAFFCGVDGEAVFRARDWLTTDTRSITIQGYIGHDEIPAGAQGAHMIDVPVTSWQRARIINRAALARTGSTQQTASDAPSIALYEEQDYSRNDFENNADSQVAFLASRLVAVAKDLRLRVDQVKIAGTEDSENRMLWDTHYGDLLSIRVETPFGWGFERLVQVWGLQHKITADDWELTLKLDDSLTEIL